MALAEYWQPDGHINLPPDLSYEDWAELGSILIKLEKGILWNLGSWWLYGERSYGESAAQALPTGYALSTIQAAANVVKKFPPGQRHDGLTWSHHREVMALEPAQAEVLLKEAEADHLSTSALRGKVREAHSRAIQDRVIERQAPLVEDPFRPAPTVAPTYPVIIAAPPWTDMTTDHLKATPVPAMEDAVLLLHVTVPALARALGVLESWGFRYKSHMVLMGQHLDARYYTEDDPYLVDEHSLLLIGQRGHALLPAGRLTSVVMHRTAPHTWTPAELAQQLWPELSSFEMFPR